MMITEKKIEAAAKGIFYEYYPNGYGGVANYAATSESHRENLRRCARAALEAAEQECNEETK